MKADSFVTTADEKYQASENLLSTEQTDAINSGIVDVSSGYSRHSYSPSTQQSRPVNKQNVNHVDGDSIHEQNNGQLAPENKTSQKVTSNSSLKTSLNTSAKQAMRKSIHKVLENSELEGIDDAYYRGKRVYHAPRNIKSIARTGKTILAKSTSKEAAKKTAAKQQSKIQAQRYFKRNVYKKAATRKIKRAAVKKTLLSIGKPLFGKLALIAAPILLISFGILLCFLLLIAAISSSVKEDETSFGSLTGVQLEVAQALRAQGLDNIQIAAIMGNISGESGWNPTAEYHGEGNNTSYEYGYGLFQFTDTTEGVGNYTNYKNWAKVNGKALDSAAAQTEYFISKLPSAWETGLHTSGYYMVGLSQFYGKNVSYSAWLKETDLALATYAFLACYERPAAWAAQISFAKRFAEAQKFYTA
ncbi:phage tail tip lysozyme, partial [Streptococcus equi]|uniref:phage tail tip lysozyme n=1 Tax=Streptococcus equi TaxID=1336 RepID=UPI001D10EC62